MTAKYESPAMKAFKAKQQANPKNMPKGTLHSAKSKRAQKQERRRENEAMRRERREAIVPPKINTEVRLGGNAASYWDRLTATLFPRHWMEKQKREAASAEEE